jgi:SAM-dependent methyltransferase
VDKSVNNVALGDSLLQSSVLESNAAAVNYHAWLCSMAWPYLGDNPLEIGSGMGDYAQSWLDLGLERITLSEVDANRRRRLHERFQGDSRVAFATIDLSAERPATYSCVVSFNVMEHVPDDIAAFRAAHALLRPGGTLVTFAPAFPFAMSKFDRSIGHVRRYLLADIRDRYEQVGFEIVEARYCNAPGLLAWFVGMRLLRMTPKAGPTLSVWDRAVVPVTSRLERRRPVPFGQSVLCVGRRRPSGDPASAERPRRAPVEGTEPPMA